MEVLIDNAVLAETSSSILAVEARHNAFLRTGLGSSPFPTTFDTGLTAVWAYNLAQQFVVSCPVTSDLGLVRLPQLNLMEPIPAPPVAAGTPITFTWDPNSLLIHVSPSTPLYMAAVSQNVSDLIWGPATRTGLGSGSVSVPSALPNGSVFACLTTFSGGLTLDELTEFGTLAGPIEITVS